MFPFGVERPPGTEHNRATIGPLWTIVLHQSIESAQVRRCVRIPLRAERLGEDPSFHQWPTHSVTWAVGID